jgi:glycerophosphoryl diester phosphodiesterase
MIRRTSRLRDLSFPVVVAHRGFRTRAPENTLAAFEAAATVGAAMIEFDVGLTRDGVPVVIHDAEVDRTTDGVGRVDALTLAEIQALDAGGWFHPRFAGERVPTLAQVLDRMGGRVALNIEIKPEAALPRRPMESGRESEIEPEMEPVERQVMALVQARGLAESVLISSFDGGVLERLAISDAPVALGVLTEGGDIAEAIRRCARLGAFSWHPDFRRLSADAVRRVRRETGARILPYTVNDPAEMDKLLALGADGFFTDDPEAGRRRLGQE